MLNIRLNGDMMEVVDSFKYLGSCFSSDGGVKGDVCMRIQEGVKAFDAMKKVWNERNVTLEVKRELYERIVVPTVMYGSETWAMRAEEKNKLDVTEMNCLRSIVCVVL